VRLGRTDLSSVRDGRMEKREEREKTEKMHGNYGFLI